MLVGLLVGWAVGVLFSVVVFEVVAGVRHGWVVERGGSGER